MENFQIPEEKICVIYPGVDRPKTDIPESRGNKSFTFGLSAPSFGKKGGYVFLKALNLLQKKGYDFRARVIYPKHKKNPWLQFLLAQYGLREKIEFLPYQKDMTGFYESADCFVMPSVIETFGLIALESMIRRKPVIVSSLAGASEIINHGENGFVFDKQSHADLAEKMEFFLNNSADYREISQNAYNTAFNHNWEVFYENFKQGLGMD